MLGFEGLAFKVQGFTRNVPLYSSSILFSETLFRIVYPPHKKHVLSSNSRESYSIYHGRFLNSGPQITSLQYPLVVSPQKTPLKKGLLGTLF